MILPSAEAVAWMVGQGWALDALLAMPARDFGFWFATVSALEEQKAEAMREAAGRQER